MEETEACRLQHDALSTRGLEMEDEILGLKMQISREIKAKKGTQEAYDAMQSELTRQRHSECINPKP